LNLDKVCSSYKLDSTGYSTLPLPPRLMLRTHTQRDSVTPLLRSLSGGEVKKGLRSTLCFKFLHINCISLCSTHDTSTTNFQFPNFPIYQFLRVAQVSTCFAGDVSGAKMSGLEYRNGKSTSSRQIAKRQQQFAKLGPALHAQTQTA